MRKTVTICHFALLHPAASSSQRRRRDTLIEAESKRQRNIIYKESVGADDGAGDGGVCTEGDTNNNRQAEGRDYSSWDRCRGLLLLLLEHTINLMERLYRYVFVCVCVVYVIPHENRLPIRWKPSACLCLLGWCMCNRSKCTALEED